MVIQTALITGVICLSRDFSDINRIGSNIWHFYRIKIELEYTMKILDWIRIAKIFDPFNTTLGRILTLRLQFSVIHSAVAGRDF